MVGNGASPTRSQVPVGPSPAGVALAKAIEWNNRIEAEGICRAAIAREENITRARVTQLMKLLTLPADTQAKLLDDDLDYRRWSIRRAIRASAVER